MLNIISQFQFYDNDIGGYERIKNSHVKDLYVITTENGTQKYILQKLDISKYNNDPVNSIKNLANILCYLRARIVMFGGDPSREGLDIVHTKEGQYYYKDKKNDIWIVYPCIKDSFAVEVADESFYRVVEVIGLTVKKEDEYRTRYDIVNKAGIAYGRFLKHMNKFPVNMLCAVDGGINNIRSKYEALEKMEKEIGESSSIQYELKCVRKYKYLIDILDNLKIRVLHNRSTVENVFFDKKTGMPLGVKGLDKAVSGPGIYDFGNFVYSSACDNISGYLRDDLYEAFTRGYLSSSSMLTENEVNNLAKICMVAAYYRVVCYLEEYVLSLDEVALENARLSIKVLIDMDYKSLWMEAIVKRWADNYF